MGRFIKTDGGIFKTPDFDALAYVSAGEDTSTIINPFLSNIKFK